MSGKKKEFFKHKWKTPGFTLFSSLENNWTDPLRPEPVFPFPQALETFLEKITTEDPQLMKVITIYQQDESLRSLDGPWSGGMLMVAYGGIVRDEVCVMGFIGIFCVFTVQYVFISSPWWPWQFGSYSLLVDCTNPEGNPGWWVIHLFEPVVGHFRS